MQRVMTPEEVFDKLQRRTALLSLLEWHLNDAKMALNLAVTRMRGPAEDPAHVRVDEVHEQLCRFGDYLMLTTDEINVEIEANWYKNILAHVAVVAMDEKWAGLPPHERLGLAVERLAKMFGIPDITEGITRKGETVAE